MTGETGARGRALVRDVPASCTCYWQYDAATDKWTRNEPSGPANCMWHSNGTPERKPVRAMRTTTVTIYVDTRNRIDLLRSRMAADTGRPSRTISHDDVIRWAFDRAEGTR